MPYWKERTYYDCNCGKYSYVHHYGGRDYRSGNCEAQQEINMQNDLKAILFALVNFIFWGSFFGKWIETKDIVSGLIFGVQVILMTIVLSLGIAFFLWLGFKIFHD